LFGKGGDVRREGRALAARGGQDAQRL
jgi:hypothetical protein